MILVPTYLIPYLTRLAAVEGVSLNVFVIRHLRDLIDTKYKDIAITDTEKCRIIDDKLKNRRYWDASIYLFFPSREWFNSRGGNDSTTNLFNPRQEGQKMINPFNFNRKKERGCNDTIMVIDDEMVEFYPVISRNETTIQTDGHTFTRQDATIRQNPEGGLYFIYHASLKYLQECEHLRQVETNVALKSMFSFRSLDNKNLTFWGVLVVLLITIFILR
jgi:hypothetical protein